MTAIVGVSGGGHVYVGGDSASQNDFTVMLHAAGKVFRKGEFIMGCAGAHRFSDLVRYSLVLPPIAEGANLDMYMATEFANALRNCLKLGGQLDIENTASESTQSVILVGIRGVIYIVDSAFAVVRPAEGIGAVGSGAEVALGALHVTGELAPEKRVLAALEAAERWTNSVRGPFMIESL